ncbi:MAG: hypothetical protein C4330_13225 [Chitinophagaceae bacterium]
MLSEKRGTYTIINEKIRIKFGSYVAVALELLLGADVLATAVAPTWNDIGQLAEIAVLRSALNYFLEKELENSGMGRNDSVYAQSTTKT